MKCHSLFGVTDDVTESAKYSNLCTETNIRLPKINVLSNNN